MNGYVNDVCRLSFLCWFGGNPGIELIPHPGRPSMSLSGHRSMYVIQSQFPLPTGRGSVRLGWRDSPKSSYEG